MPMKTCMKRMGALHYLVHLFTATLMTCMLSWIYLTFLAVPGKLTNYCELPRTQDEGMKVWGRKREGGGGLRMGHGGVRGGGHSYYYPLSGPF